MQRCSWLFIWCLLIGIVCALLYITMPRAVGLLENIVKDTMFIFRGDITSDDRVVIVDVDERSLQELGQWPWSRDILAKIVDNLKDARVAIVGFDIIFSEEDRSSPSKIVEKIKLKTSQKLPNYDDIFSQSIQNAPVVTGFFFSMQDDGVKADRVPKTDAIIIEKDKPKDSFLPKAYRPVLSIEKINDSAYSNGFINYSAKFDKVARDAPSIIEYDDVLYPSLSLEISRLALGHKKITVQYNENGINALYLGKKKIPTDLYGNIKINYTGYYPAYKYISASDIFHGAFLQSDIAGKIVLLGTSAAGLFDIRSSPYNTVMPGVEAHANLIDNILNENFIYEPQWAMSINLACIILLPILCFITLLSSRVYMSVGLGILLMTLVLCFHYYLMFHGGIVLHSSILILELIAIYFIGNILNYIYENRQKEFIKTKFANKVSKEVMEDIVKDSSKVALKGTTKEISIFFSDIRGFTTISEALNSPELLIDFLNAYMTPMTDIIIKNKGTVDKFIGDAIMAYWNAPKQLKEHADFALKASIEQIEALKKLNKEFKEKNMPKINIGIGLNTGECIVGEMGSAGRSDYTCIGDSVNLASRLEGLNKEYGTNIILSEFFLAKLSNPTLYKLQELGSQKVKGKNQSVKIYACFGYA